MSTMNDDSKKNLQPGTKDTSSLSGLILTLGAACCFLFFLSGKYYSPLSDFFSFKANAESLLHLSLPLSKRGPFFPLLMGAVSLLIPAKKAILWAGILISNTAYLGSIVLVYKISQKIGIRNSFLVSWFFAFSSLSLYCATQPLPEAAILFLILLSFYVVNDKLSLSISGLAALTRYDAALAAIAKFPKIMRERKWHLIFFTFLALLPSVTWLVFCGKGGYVKSAIYLKHFLINKEAGNFVSLLRSITLFYMPDDHWASLLNGSQFHASWWVQLIWIANISIILIGLFPLIKQNKPDNWKIPAFFIAYLFFLWYYYWTSWRFMYFIAWMFPLFTIAGIEYFLRRWQHQKKIFVSSLLGTLGIVAVYSLYSTPHIKNLYLEYFNFGFNINSLKRMLIFLPICTYILCKARLLKLKGSLVLSSLFLLLLPLVYSHITTVNNMYDGLWDLRAGLKAVKDKVKNKEKILIPLKMFPYATYLSDIPTENIVTPYTKDLSLKDIKYIASYRSWDVEPVLQHLADTPEKIMLKDQEVPVTEVYHIGIFRLYQPGSVTSHGNVRADKVQPKFGRASFLFDGAGSRLQIVDSPDWAFGPDNFTVDFWVRFMHTSGTQVLIGLPYYSPNKAWQTAWEEESKCIKFSYSTDGENNTDARFPWLPSTDTWYHVAVVRNGTVLKAFVNGLQIGKTHNIGSASIYDSANPLYIGSRGTEEHFNGWMDEIRISKGIARWTADFTPPSDEYTIDSYTRLLLRCNDSDNSTLLPEEKDSF